jgi:hypothetical protein
MFEQKSVPSVMWKQAEAINTLAVCLEKQILALQRTCSLHQWKKVTAWDPKYSPRVDGLSTGANVIMGYRCVLCAVFKPLIGAPYDICWLCGGKMENVGHTFYGEDSVHIHRCRDCGKEYDTI